MVERGTFIGPLEAVLVLMAPARGFDPHRDLRRELLRRGIGSAREGSFVEAEEV